LLGLRTIFLEVLLPVSGVQYTLCSMKREGSLTHAVQQAMTFNIRVCKNFARGMIGTEMTVIIGIRYPIVLYVAATLSA
jgi:uncharacterized protein (UPF0333 family)